MQTIDKTDLDWWLEVADTLKWKFARTYAKTAPHSYIVRGQHLDYEDFQRAVRVIRTYGEPRKYWNSTGIYLTDDDRKLRWWTMGDTLDGTTIINRVDTDASYGVQNAPRTYSGIPSMYDGLATTYDQDHGAESEDSQVWKLITTNLPQPHPRVLDVGCGTGRTLDLKITKPSHYTGVDPSQGMLNELIRKHSRAKSIYPMSAEDLVKCDPDEFGRNDLVCALFGSPSHFDPRSMAKLMDYTTDCALFMFYEPGYLPDYHNGEPPTHLEEVRDAGFSLMAEFPSYVNKIGKFDTILLSKKGMPNVPA